MKKWRETRNYRRVKSNNGSIIINIITVDGVDVEVTEEVYLAYSQAERRERYLSEVSAESGTLSLDQMDQDNVEPGYVGMDCIPSAEDCWLEKNDQRDLKKTLSMAVHSLDESEQELIKALFWKKISIREYARTHGVSDMAIRKRRDRIIKKLKKYFP